MALNDQDVATVKGMLARGDQQRDVAAYFGIAEEGIGAVAKGELGAQIPSASEDSLPPPGPYLAGRTALKAIDTLLSLRALIDQAMDELDVYERVVLRDAEDRYPRGRNHSPQSIESVLAMRK